MAREGFGRDLEPDRDDPAELRAPQGREVRGHQTTPLEAAAAFDRDRHRFDATLLCELPAALLKFGLTTPPLME